MPYEWLRLGQSVGLAAALVLAGELLLPTSGLDGFAGRTALWLAYPLLLWVTGFLNEEERRAAGRLLSPSAVRSALAGLRAGPAEGPAPDPEPPDLRRPRLTREALEAEQRDEDAIR